MNVSILEAVGIWRKSLFDTSRLDPHDFVWRCLVFAVAILFAGLMFMGYAVFDELFVYCVLAIMLLPDAIRVFHGDRSVLAKWVNPGVPNEARIEKIHRIIFAITACYLTVETIRGIIFLGDIRVIRFTVMFMALGLICWSTRPPQGRHERDLAAQLIVVCTAIYFVAYVAFGFVDEFFFSGWRFNLQGHLWVGTSAAVVPGILMLPAAMRLASSTSKSDQKIFWFGSLSYLFVAFYYQSRLSWMALALFIVGLIVLGRYGRAGILAILYLGLVIFAPWNDPRPAVPNEIGRYVSQVVSDFPSEEPKYNLTRFAHIIFGAFMPVRSGERVIATYHGRRVAEFDISQKQKDLARTINGLKDRGYDVRIEQKAKVSPDIDRKLAILAAIKTVSSNGLGRLLFGFGYYTHRYVMLPYIHQIAAEYEYAFPRTYNSIVRTATMNGMLVDNGAVGFSLFLSLFALTAIGACLPAFNGDRASIAVAVCSIMSLAMLGLSQFAGSNFDMVVIYLALMPGGLIMSVVPRNDLGVMT